MQNHFARPTGSMGVPEAHANIVGSSDGPKHGRKKWKGRKGGMFKGRGKGKSRGKGDKKVTGESSGGSKNACYRCGRSGHWSRNCRVPRHLIDVRLHSSESKNEGGPKSHFTTEPKARTDDMDIDAKTKGGDVRKDDSEDGLLDDDFDIFGDLE